MRLLVTITVLAACGDDGGSTPGNDAPPTGGEAIELVDRCELPAGAPTTLMADLTYGPDPLHRFDLVRPTAPGAYPLVVMIHGGGWSAGNRVEYRDLMLGVAGQGYVTASLEYRLAAAPANVFPAQVQDVRCALLTLRARAATYAIDPARVVAFGGSAGGHLAAMLGVAADAGGLDGTCAESAAVDGVDGVVSLAGPMDLRASAELPPAADDIVRNFLGADRASVPAAAALASPITHAGAASPPFFLIHGTLDTLVPVEQSRAMHTALRAAGARATLFEGAFGHGDPPPSAADGTTITCTLAAFLAATLTP